MNGSTAQRADGVEIRLVHPFEHAELRRVRLNALAYTPELAAHLAAETAAHAEFWIERASNAAAAETTATFVGVDDRAFVGVVDGYLRVDGRVVDVGGMWVRADRRGSGLGQALLDAVCAWARDRGAVRIGLWVRETNAQARRLYAKSGFVVKPSESTESGTGVRMEKVLEPSRAYSARSATT